MPPAARGHGRSRRRRDIRGRAGLARRRGRVSEFVGAAKAGLRLYSAGSLQASLRYSPGIHAAAQPIHHLTNICKPIFRYFFVTFVSLCP